MANALKYISNIGKSITYSAVDQVKKMNPIVTEFAEQNNELGKILYESVKDFKGTVKKTQDYIIKSQVGEFATEYKKALFEDLKTGKFYNRERIDRMQIEASGNLLDFNMDDPFSFADDSPDFDDGDWSDADSIGNDDIFMANQMDIVGEKTAVAIAQATGRAAEYMVASNRQGIAATQRHNEYLVGKINVGLGAVHSGVSSLIQFNDRVVKPYVDRSIDFYNITSTLDKERNDLLKKILENQTNMYKSTVSESKGTQTVSYDDIVSGGIPDLKLYGKKIMQNFDNMTGGIIGMNNMFEGGNMLKMFAGAPLKVLTDAIVKKMTPKAIEEAMGGLNDTLSGFFGSLMSKFTSMKNSDDESTGIISKWIGQLFGINTSINTKYNTAKYNRGALPFDGETKMAITQVIPMHLSKIESALTGQTERMFDYKKGSFTDLKQIESEYENLTKNYAMKSSSDLRSEMTKMTESVILDSAYDKQLLEKSIKEIFERTYESGELLDLRNKSSIDMGIDSKSFDIIKGLLENVDKHLLMQYQSNVWENRSSQAKYLANEESDPTSIYRLLANGFNIDQYSDTKDGRRLNPYDIKNAKNPALQNNLVILKDNKGHNMYYYLQRLTEDVEKMRYVMLSDTQPKSRHRRSRHSSPISGIHNNEITGVEKAYGFYTDEELRRRENSKDLEYIEKQYERERQNRLKRFRLGTRSGVPFAPTRLPSKSSDVIMRDTNKGYIWDDKDYSELGDGEYAKAISAHFSADREYNNFLRRVEGEKEKKDSVMGKIKNDILGSDNVPEGLKSFIIGLDDISNKPLNTIAKILNKVDQRLYEIIYGSEDGEKLSPKSFMGALTARLTSTFSTVTSFIKDDILLPMKDLLFGEDVKDKFKDLGNRFLNFMGIDIDSIKDRASGSLKGFGKKATERPLNYVKKSMPEVYGNIGKYIKGEKTAEALQAHLQLKEDNDRRAARARDLAQGPLSLLSDANLFNRYGSIAIGGKPYPKKTALMSDEEYINSSIEAGKSISLLINEGYGDKLKELGIEGFARGTRAIKKTGVAVVSEGEMIIPSELNPFYNKRTDKERQIREEGRIQRLFNRRNRNLNINAFADGDDDIEIDEDRIAIDKNKSSLKDRIRQRITKTRSTSSGDGRRVEYETDRFKYNENDYIDEPLTAKTMKVGRNAATKVMNRLGIFGRGAKSNAEKIKKLAQSDKLFNDAVADVTSDFSKYLPGSAAGAVIGGSLSLITGAVGGPLLGAAFGAATNLIIESDKVKDWLFGKRDESGEREGNIISKDLTQNIEKYLPNMAKGATVGGITSILPFVPGGPVSGIILGSAIGFATKSEGIQKMLFGTLDVTTGERGNDGLLKPEFINTLKGSIPEMTLGALGGVIAGPFGLVGNIALGSAIGLATQSTRFQEALFGKYNEETEEYEGGILGIIRTKFIDPITTAVKPLGKQLQLGVKGIFSSLGRVFHSIFDEELRIPIRKFLKERILDRAVKAVSTVGKVVTRPAISIASAPFRAIGAVGDHFRRRQIASGNADYMTAEERVQYRKDYEEKVGKRMFLRKRSGFRNDRFQTFDQDLIDMDEDQLSSMRDSLDFLQDPTKKADELRASSISNINKAINEDFGLGYSTSKAVLKHLDNGEEEKAYAVIRRSNLSQEEQQRLNLIISKNYSDYTTSNKIKGDVKSSTAKMSKRLQKLGLEDLDATSKSSVNKYKTLIDNELEGRKNLSPEQFLNKEEDKRHSKIVSLLEKLIDTVKITADPNSQESQALRSKMFNKGLSESMKSKSFARIFDGGDSKLYGDYEFEYSGNKLIRYKIDPSTGEKVDISEIDQTTMMPIDEDGKIIRDNYGADGYNEYTPVRSVAKKATSTASKILSKIKRAPSAIWNARLGSMTADFVKDKYDARTQKRIQAKADKQEVERKRNASGGIDDESSSDISYGTNMFGKPVKWVKDESGRWHIDETDHENQQHEEETNMFKDALGWTGNKLGKGLGWVGKGLGWIGGKVGGVVSGTLGLLGRLFGISTGDGTMKKGAKLALGGLGILTAASFANKLEDWWTDSGLPKVKQFWTESIYPKIEKYIEPIKPTLARAAVGIDKVISGIPTAISNLGNRIKTFVTEDLPRVWHTKILPFYGGGIEWISEKIEGIVEGMVHLVLPALGGVIKGAAKGAWGVLKTDIFSFFAGLGRRDTKSLLKQSSKTKASSQSLPNKTNNSTTKLSPMQNLYQGMFGTSATNDLYGSGYIEDKPVTDKALEDYYKGDSNTYPRDSNQYSTTGLASNMSYTSNESIYSPSKSTRDVINPEAYADYSEGLFNDGSQPEIDNVLAGEYDREVKNNSWKSNSLLGLGSNSNASVSEDNFSGLADRTIRGTDGGLYYNNGDGTLTDTQTGDILPADEVVNMGDLDVFEGFGKDSAGTRLLKTLGRAAATGKSGVFGKVSKLIKPKKPAKTVIGKVFNAGRHTTSGAFNLVEGTAKTSKKISENLVELGIESTKKNFVQEAAEAVARGGSNVIPFPNMIAEGTEDALVKVGKQSDGILKKLWKKIDDFFLKLPKNKTVKKALKESLESAGKEATEAVAEKSLKGLAAKLSKFFKGTMLEVAEKATKKLAQAVGRIIPYIDLAFKIWDFLDGYNNAATYLGMLDEDVTPMLRIVSGLAQLINGIVTLGFVPLSIIFDVITKFVAPLFNIDMSEYEELRESAIDTVLRHNEIQGTDYTLEQYNKRDSLWNRITGKYNKAEETQKEIRYYIDNPSARGTSNTSISVIDNITPSNQYSSNSGSGSGINLNQYTRSTANIPTPTPFKPITNIDNTHSYATVNSGGYNTIKINKQPTISSQYTNINNSSRYDRYIASGSGLPTAKSYGKYIAGNSDQPNGVNIVEQICIIIGINESDENYASINPDDGGSLSVGKYQFNGGYDTNAKALFKAICRKNAFKSKEILGNELYEKLTGSASLKGFVPNINEINAIGQLLSTDFGMMAQDEFMTKRVEEYIKAGKSLGIISPKSMIYFADMYHQNPSRAKKVVNYTKSKTNVIDIETLYRNTVKADPSFYTNYKTRRDRTYVFSLENMANSISTTGYYIGNINRGYAYTDYNIPEAEKKSSWFDQIMSKVFDAGKAWFGIFDKGEEEIVDDPNSVMLYQSTDYSDELYKAPANTNKSNLPLASNVFNPLDTLPISDKEIVLNGQKTTIQDTFNRHRLGLPLVPEVYSGVPNINTRMLLNNQNPFKGKSQPGTLKEVNDSMASNELKRKYEKYNEDNPLWEKMAAVTFGLYSMNDIRGDLSKKEIKALSNALQGMSLNRARRRTVPKGFPEYLELWREFEGYDDKIRDDLANYTYLVENYPDNKDFKSKYKTAQEKYFYNDMKGYGVKAVENERARMIEFADYYSNVYVPNLEASFPNAGMKQIENLSEYMDMFDKSAKGSGFISQLDPRYAFNRLGDETIAQAGCGPATAAMAINGLSAKGSLMDATSSIATRYKDKGGVKASYFADVFGRAGARTAYHEGANRKSMIENSLAGGDQVVLMGRDTSNRSKDNSPFGPNNHYVLAKAVSGNKILINDPELSGPRLYDKNILNNANLGISVSAGNSETLSMNAIYDRIKNNYLKLTGSYIEEKGDGGPDDLQSLSDTNMNSKVVGEANANNIISYARSFIGKLKYSQDSNKRYTLAKGGMYADCSSFVWHVFGKFNIKLGTYTGAQLHNGIEVQAKDLQPGDLVMFKNTSKTNNHNYERGVSHVGIYTGNDSFIHMSSSRGVVEVQLSTSSLFKNKWLCGRRVINNVSAKSNTSSISLTKPDTSSIRTTTHQSAKGSRSQTINKLDKVMSERIKLPNTRQQNDLSAKNTNIVQPENTVNKLLQVVIKLLGKMVNNTDNVKDIVGLLTQVLEKTDRENVVPESTQVAASGSGNSNRPARNSKSRLSAVDVLSRHNQSDNVDMNALINDLTTILRD